MLTTDRDRAICNKYSAQDETGHVHCKDCPLAKDKEAMICKAVAHYDRHLREWAPDDLEV